MIMNNALKEKRHASRAEDRIIKEKTPPAMTPRTSTRHSYPLQKDTVNPRVKEKEKAKENSRENVIIAEFSDTRKKIAGRNKNNLDTARDQTTETKAAVRAGTGDTGTKETEKEKHLNTD